MDESEGLQNQTPNLSSNGDGGAKDSKGKSCKGCLYYSSLQKSKSRTPTCIGLSKTLEQGISSFSPSLISRYFPSRMFRFRWIAKKLMVSVTSPESLRFVICCIRFLYLWSWLSCTWGRYFSLCCCMLTPAMAIS